MNPDFMRIATMRNEMSHLFSIGTNNKSDRRSPQSRAADEKVVDSRREEDDSGYYHEDSQDGADTDEPSFSSTSESINRNRTNYRRGRTPATTYWDETCCATDHLDVMVAEGDPWTSVLSKNPSVGMSSQTGQSSSITSQQNAEQPSRAAINCTPFGKAAIKVELPCPNGNVQVIGAISDKTGRESPLKGLPPLQLPPFQAGGMGAIEYTRKIEALQREIFHLKMRIAHGDYDETKIDAPTQKGETRPVANAKNLTNKGVQTTSATRRCREIAVGTDDDEGPAQRQNVFFAPIPAVVKEVEKKCSCEAILKKMAATEQRLYDLNEEYMSLAGKMKALESQEIDRTCQLERTKQSLALKEEEIKRLLKDLKHRGQKCDSLQKKLDHYLKVASSLSRDIVSRDQELSRWRDECTVRSQEAEVVKAKLQKVQYYLFSNGRAEQ